VSGETPDTRTGLQVAMKRGPNMCGRQPRSPQRSDAMPADSTALLSDVRID